MSSSGISHAARLQRALDEVQALGQRGLSYWLYFLTAKQQQVEARMRAKGELAPAPAQEGEEGLGELEGR